MNDFEEIEKRLQRAGKQLRGQVPVDWKHPAAEAILMQMKSAAAETSGSTDMTAKPANRVIAFPSWLTHAATGIAAAFITAFTLLVFPEDPGQPSGTSNLHAPEVVDHADLRTRSASPVTRSPDWSSASTVEIKQIERVFTSLDASLVSRSERVLSATETAENPGIIAFRNELLSSLQLYLETILFSQANPQPEARRVQRLIEQLESEL